LVIIFTNCSTNEKQNLNEVISTQKKIENLNSITEITSFLKPKIQTFNIDPSIDTLIKCEKGTVLYLPKDLFNLNKVSKENHLVQIKITEYSSISDFIGGNLTTLSDDKILETAGMLNLSATVNNKSLSINKGKEYAIYFPKTDTIKKMTLFYGSKDSTERVNWDLAPTIKKEELKPQLLKNYKIGLSSYGFESTNDKVKRNIKKSIQTISQYFSKNFQVSKIINKEFYENQYSVFIKIQIDSSGKVNNISNYKSTIVTSEMEKKISDFLYQMPPIDIETSINEFSVVFSGFLDVDKKEYNKQFKEKYSSFRNQAITKIDKGELNYYILTATKLGWINCDRFWNTSEEKIDFIVKVKSPNDTKVIITFNEIKSVMQGEKQMDKVIFKNIPINKEIKVIGISYSNGLPTMGVGNTITDNNEFELSSFNQFSLEELEIELNKIN